jgi:transglutaminase-like putative cysteine protease
MARIRIAQRFALFFLPALLAQLDTRLEAAAIKVLSGKIRAIDAKAGTVTVAPGNPGPDQVLRVARGSIIAIGMESAELSRLAAGQRVTIFYDPQTRLVSKLRAVAEAASGSKPMAKEAEGRGGLIETKRTVLRPAFPDRTGQSSNTEAERNREYKLTIAPARSIHGVYSYEVSLPHVRATDWEVFTPRPPELPGQTGMRARLSPGGEPATDVGPKHRPLLVAHIPADSPARVRAVSVRAEYWGTLLARHLARRWPGESIEPPQPLAPQDRAAALARGGSYDVDSPAFRKWLADHRLSRGPREGQIEYARRVFLAIKRSFSYEYDETMDRHASRTCASGRSDCGGMAVVFAAALRAHDIPARVLVGRWARSAEAGARLGKSGYYQSHVKAEFYADGVGWVPVDPSMAVVYDRDPDGLRYFGRDEGDFLTLHVDPDLVLGTLRFGPQSIFCSNGPLPFWVSGSGSTDSPKVREDWQVEERRPDRSRPTTASARAFE